MAKVTFTIRSQKNPSRIYVRFVDKNAIDLRATTNFSINPVYWSISKNWILPNEKFDDRHILENGLKELETRIYKERTKAAIENIDIDKNWFKNTIDNIVDENEKKEKNLLINHFTEYKNNLPNKIRNGKQGVSAGTIRNYNTTIKRLLKFQDEINKPIYLKDVDLNFHTNYINFATNNLNLSPNSIGKDIKQIKTICFDARENGDKINDQLLSKNFNAPTEKTLFITLNKDELSILKKFKGQNHLENARDWLLIGCWSACRVTDLLLLNKSKIIELKEGRIIRYTQIKTGKTISVPIHPEVEEILSKNNGFPKKISAEKFNLYIKELAKKCNIDEMTYGSIKEGKNDKMKIGMFPKYDLVTSHICRRSFATNHYNELPNKLIMAVTGHSTEKMLLEYIGVTEVDHINDFMNLWKS